MKHSLVSWNVNGIRAIEKKGFIPWVEKLNPTVLALQETKAQRSQISDALAHIGSYHLYWSEGIKKGYSGVAVYSKEEALSISTGFADTRFNSEGRILIGEFTHYILLNIYFPNGKGSAERLSFKLAFYQEFITTIKRLKKKNKMIIVCGDVNTAHFPIDLARPKENETSSGFLPEERAYLDMFLSQGLVDTLRVFHPEPGLYTWWDYKTKARARNIGWRIDYFYISASHSSQLRDAYILDTVQGSDHCPIGITITI